MHCNRGHPKDKRGVHVSTIRATWTAPEMARNLQALSTTGLVYSKSSCSATRLLSSRPFWTLRQPFFPPLKSLACKFLVMLGSFTLRPSSSGAILTWHPNLDVSVNPNARSSMSFSSSSGSGILSYISGSSTVIWQVEQAQEPPQAPSVCWVHAINASLGSRRTLHFQIFWLCDIK